MSTQRFHPIAPSNCTSPQARKPKLLEQVRHRVRSLHYSIRTEEAYVDWVRRFVLFHGQKHPSCMGEREDRTGWSEVRNSQHFAAEGSIRLARQ